MAKTKKSNTTIWTDVVILLGLIAASIAASLLWTVEDRFTMIGIFSALLISLRGHTHAFAGVFLLAGTFILLSFSRTPFAAILFILAADAAAATWYLGRMSWDKPRNPADLGVLVTSFLSVFMFLIADLYPVDPIVATYFIFLFYLLRPLSWIPPKQLSERENSKFEFLFGVLTILAFTHIYHPQESLAFSLIAALCGGALAFLGSGLAAPTLIFLSLAHLVPGWVVFGGLVGFCALYGGWPLRILFVLMAAGYTLQFKLTENPFFWATAICASVILAVLFVRKLPKLEDLKNEWQGILLALVLFALPIYVDPTLIKLDVSQFDGATLGIAFAFLSSITLFLFWKPNAIYGRIFSLVGWVRFVSYIQAEIKNLPVEVAHNHLAEAGATQTLATEKNSSQVLVWLVVLALAIIALGGL